ncbi:MAG: hypothetical protein M0R80_00660 [Proteobacteria bacterium]|nr:hypothetical protein [Pseudomonadota bacterium]
MESKINSHCHWCDQPLVFATKNLLWYQCGRMTHRDGDAGFTCSHQGRLDKTRCRADNGKPMGTFKDYLAKI